LVGLYLILKQKYTK